MTIRFYFDRLPGLVSTASAAESFRSRCGSVRGAPVCSPQASAAAAPQVGQGTDKICFNVSSLLFIAPQCTVPQSKRWSILLIFNTLAKWQLSFRVWASGFTNDEQK